MQICVGSSCGTVFALSCQVQICVKCFAQGLLKVASYKFVQGFFLRKGCLKLPGANVCRVFFAERLLKVTRCNLSHATLAKRNPVLRETLCAQHVLRETLRAEHALRKTLRTHSLAPFMQEQLDVDPLIHHPRVVSRAVPGHYAGQTLFRSSHIVSRLVY